MKQRAISSFFQTKLSSPPKPSPLDVELLPTCRLKLSDYALLPVPDTKRRKTGAPNSDVTSPLPTAPSSPEPVARRVSTNKSTPKTAKSAKLSKLTPLEKQFIDLKSVNQDKILAIQVGYKFKFFGRDAVVASQLLNIMLIRGNLELHDRTHDRFAYCLIPDNRLHIHLQRLLNHGLKVGVVKQTESAAIKQMDVGNKSGLFERKITGVYTKATYMGDELLTGDPAIQRLTSLASTASEGTEAYIVCIDESEYPRETAIVAVQPVTGAIVWDKMADNGAREALDTRITYLKPSEVIVVGTGEIRAETRKILRIHSPNAVVQFRNRRKRVDVETKITTFFESIDNGKNAAAATHYLVNCPHSVGSCVGELIEYLEEFKLSNVFSLVSNFQLLTDSRKYMHLPGQTLRALDVFDVHEGSSIMSRAGSGTLFWLLNHAKTRKGARTLREWIARPLVDLREILRRLEAVQFLALGKFVHILDAFSAALAKIGSNVDLDRLLIKVHYLATYGSDKISRKDLYLMLQSFSDVVGIFRTFGETAVAEIPAPLLRTICSRMVQLSQETVVDDLLQMVVSSAAMDDRNLSEQKLAYFDVRHARFDSISRELEQATIVESCLEAELQKVRVLLKRPQLQYVTNLKETHLVEVRNGKMVDSLPKDWLKISGTKLVLRFRPPEVSRLHKQLGYHNEMALRAADECFAEYLRDVDAKYEYFRGLVAELAAFDCLLSLALAASQTAHSYVRPRLSDSQIIKATQCSHPILAALGNHVANDIAMLQNADRVLIITGPNMGGKSSYVKQVALMAIMTQIGCLLPCKEAEMGVFDLIYMRMGASDDILRGSLTFMVEMLEASNIVNHFTSKSLIVLDEIGRGTGTSDGIALAHAILSYLILDDRKPLTLFITHYPSLHVLDKHAGVANYHMSFVEEKRQNDWPEIVFLYKLVLGVMSNSYGLNVARLAGIDRKIIDNAFTVAEAMKLRIENEAVRRVFEAAGRGDVDTALKLLEN